MISANRHSAPGNRIRDQRRTRTMCGDGIEQMQFKAQQVPARNRWNDDSVERGHQTIVDRTGFPQQARLLDGFGMAIVRREEQFDRWTSRAATVLRRPGRSTMR